MIELLPHQLERGAEVTTRRLFAVGGTQRNARTLAEREVDWYRFGSGLILEIDTRSGEIDQFITYVSPAAVCAPNDPAILFKGAVIDDDMLYVCTPTEVLVYGLPDFALLRYLSLPVFNDLHHVRPWPDGRLLVASTGLDAVFEIDHNDRISNRWSAIAECDRRQSLSTSTDYRLVANTKPHLAHPNHLFLIDDEPWVTRFEQRDAISLQDPQRRIDIGLERVHDGFVVGDRVYFTTVDGKIVTASTRTLKIEAVLDLNQASNESEDRHLGWCRGLYIDGDRAWVGFSRLRLSRVRANLSWVRWGFKSFAPTRIACYDLNEQTLLDEFDVQSHGLDAIFGILPVD